MSQFEKFLDSQFNLTLGTKGVYVRAINLFEKTSKKSFEECFLDSEIVNRTLNFLEDKLSPSTWNLYVSKYQRVAKWLDDPEDERSPALWRKIKLKKIDWGEKLKDNWLTQAEFYRLLNVVDNPRDKALFGVTISGALRRGEVLSLRIRHCKPVVYSMKGKKRGGFEITFSGKTGTATVPIVKFAPLLELWLNHHPRKDNPEAPLWVSLKKPDQALTHMGISQLMPKYARRAGFKRRITFHMLRHSKITWVYQNRKTRISDEMARKMFRWSKNSLMPSRYAHLTGADSKHTFLALEGVDEKAEAFEEPQILEPRECLACGELNSATSLYCSKCGLVLNEEEAQKIILKERKRDEVMDVLSDPQILKDLQSLNDPEVRKVLDELQRRKKA